MKARSRFFALLVALCPLLAAADAALFSQSDLFHEGGNGVHTYRIPALIETRRRVLIAVADARHDSARDLPGHISLVMRRSFDGGVTWEPARTIR
jgi:sialidase-1